jgi:hypothetical protein
MACLYESFGKDMKKESSDELTGGYGYEPFLAGVFVVTCEESDPMVGNLDEAVVGDGDLVGVASQILEDLLRASEWFLGVYDPFLAIEFVHEALESIRIFKMLDVLQEPQVVSGKGSVEKVEKLTSEFLGKSAHRHEKVVP